VIQPWLALLDQAKNYMAVSEVRLAKNYPADFAPQASKKRNTYSSKDQAVQMPGYGRKRRRLVRFNYDNIERASLKRNWTAGLPSPGNKGDQRTLTSHHFFFDRTEQWNAQD
jgi:hypothetical protein